MSNIAGFLFFFVAGRKQALETEHVIPKKPNNAIMLSYTIIYLYKLVVSTRILQLSITH